MKAVFPGKPQAKLHALSTAAWKGKRIIAYISGNALIILAGPNHLLQTIFHGDDDELVAVTVDSISGKIAVCTTTSVFVYRTYTLQAQELRWTLQHTLVPRCGDKTITTLSWGQPDEILVGGSSLTLISTDSTPHELWSKPLANPVKFAAFYHDASLIATTGWHDKLVKVWTRIYFGEDGQRFDVTYLLHPTTVTDLRWRPGPPEDEHAEPVLYTTCADNILRVWAATDPHALQTLQLWTELDLTHCVQSRVPSSPTSQRKRFAFIIDNWEFKALVDKSRSLGQGSKRQQHSREYLSEVASRAPEVCVLFDDQGNMSAWGLERVGCKARRPNDVFNIAHPEGLEMYHRSTLSQDRYLQFVNFSDPSQTDTVHVLSHSFSKSIEWLSFKIDALLDPSSSTRQHILEAVWAGHSHPVDDLEAAAQDSNRPLLTSFAGKETLYWRSNPTGFGLVLEDSDSIESESIASKVHDHQVNGNHIQKHRTRLGAKAGREVVIDPDGTAFVIRNSLNGCLEHVEEFEEHETIIGYRWTQGTEDHPILAIAVPHKVFIFTVLQLDLIHLQPSWICLRAIDIRDVSNLLIVDFAWLATGDLIIAAGSQLFLHDHTVVAPDTLGRDMSWEKGSPLSLFRVASALNAQLPIFNPHFLAYCILTKDITFVHYILKIFHEKVKYYAEGDDLSTLLDLEIGILTGSTLLDSSDEEALMTEDQAISLKDRLSSTQIPWLNDEQKQHLMDVIQSVGTSEKHLRAVDNFGLLYLISLYQEAKPLNHDGKKFSQVSWREINWAFQSSSQEILVDLTTQRYHGKMLWNNARETGMFTWILDAEALKSHFEVLARNEYTKTEERNPVDCTLYYLALRKKQVLQGLWRLASWHREQAATLRLLANNFSDPRWKTAALKNAYALMGLRRFEYAASFFLLADHLKDAINVLLNQVKDVQLAIAVARVYEGDDSPTFKWLLEEKLLHLAAVEGNRWLAAWTFCMLHRRDMALQSLIHPLESLIEMPERPDPLSKHVANFDPAMVTLYRRLREGDPQKPNQAVHVDPKDEWHFVIRNARILRQMGCDILALDLVKNWTFTRIRPQPAPAAPIEEAVASEEEEEEESDEEEDEGGEDAEPAASSARTARVAAPQEPSANSILDSFGF